MNVDLHIHTTASDGTLTPELLIEEIKSRRIELFSITDHDCIDNIESMSQIAKECGIYFIKGAEISATYKGQEIHLLTYGANEALSWRVRKNQAVRDNHNEMVIDYASKKYPDISLEDYHLFERNPRSGGWKAENYLFQRGITKSLNDFFQIVNQMGRQLKFDSVKTVLTELSNSGYTVVLAHPPAYFKGKRLSEEFLNELRIYGLKGIECYSPYFKCVDEQKYYIDYCKKHDLLVTCGSDYHGSFILSRELGVDAEGLDYERLISLCE